MAAWVVLKHQLPDGTWHFDWMFDAPGGTDGGLLTFRIAPETGWPPTAGFEAVQIGAHRREYLAYEGPVSQGRGSVARVAGGECRFVDISGRAMVVELAGWAAEAVAGTGLRLRGAEIGQNVDGIRWWFDLELSR